MWTGSSFHVYIFLKNEIQTSVYDNCIAYSKKDPLASFTGRWAEKIDDKLKVRVIGGHEKQEGMINIDPSQTPSGKLCRAPFSLHMKDENTIDGIAIPVTNDTLKEKNLIMELKSYNPGKAINDLNKLEKNFPKQFR